MNEIDPKKIDVKMPKAVKDIFYSDESFMRFQNIVKKYKLNTEQSGVLMEEVILVLIGTTHPDEFVDELRGVLGLPEEQIIALAKDLEKEIFGSIKKELIKLYNRDDKKLDDKNIDPGGLKTYETDREKILNEIENPVPVKSTDQKKKEKTLLEDKLGGVVKLPKEDRVIQDEKTKPTWTQPIDPYRESTE